MNVKQTKEMIRMRFAQKRARAEYVADEMLLAERQANPRFDELKAQEGELKCKIGKAKAFGEPFEAYEKELEQNLSEQKKALAKDGLTLKDFEPQYECMVCRDAGLVNGKECACFQNAVNKELVANCGITNTNCSLKTFSPKTNAQKEAAKMLNEFCGKAETSKIRTLLLWGATGTGKTLLLTCLANDLMQKPMGVLFHRATQFSDALLQIHRAPVEEKRDEMSGLVDTDVLVIDDLGSEPFFKNVTEQYLLAVLDARMANGAITLISTNLNPLQLQERYGDRTFSRLQSDQTARIKLDGADLRLTKR